MNINSTLSRTAYWLAMTASLPLIYFREYEMVIISLLYALIFRTFVIEEKIK